jgi:phosphoribosylanthranilate isomerase
MGALMLSEANRTRVKICGITSPEDALNAARLGADAIGLVFYAPSPRSVDVPGARAVLRVLPPFVTAVGLFVNARLEEVREALDAVPLDLLQFHGDESPEDCECFDRPYIKAVPMREGVDLHDWASRYRSAKALLADSYKPGVPGGTGTSFDWSRVPMDTGKPVILAGGLSPANVAEAIHRLRPYAVDVSGGVEAAKGVKDVDKMAAFFREVNSVTAS